jgi:hypothetical protein
MSGARPQPNTNEYKKLYGQMEPQICELVRQAELAMTVFDKETLFLRAVEQLERMLKNFKANYACENFHDVL